MGESLKRKRAKAHKVRCETQTDQFKKPTLFHGHAEERGTLYTCDLVTESTDVEVGNQLILHAGPTKFDVVSGNLCVATMCHQDREGLRSRWGDVFSTERMFPVIVCDKNTFTGHLRISLPPIE